VELSHREQILPRPAHLGLLGFFDDDAVLAVVLAQAHGDAFTARSREVVADVLRADRQLAVSAIDQARELDRGRPAEVDDRVERRANRPAGEEDVVHEDHGLVLDRERDVGPADHRRPAHAQVVAVERDVERPDRQRGAVDVRDLRGEAMREAHPARAQADERQILGAPVLLEDLVGDTGEGSVERGLVENLRLLAVAWCGATHLLSLRASPGALKGKLRYRLLSLYMASFARVNPTRGPTRFSCASAGSSGARARR